MSDVEPVVRLMIVCEDVRRHPDNPTKIDVLGLVSTIHWSSNPPFPLRHPRLCVFLQVAGGRGTGEGRIVAVHADSDREAFAGPPHVLSFGLDPLAAQGLVFRLRECVFPEAGLYWLQFRYNEKVIAQQPLEVR